MGRGLKDWNRGCTQIDVDDEYDAGPSACVCVRLRLMTLAFWLILVATVLRLGFGAALGLGVDESYMVASGRVLSLGYFDHPPAAWWLSWGAAHLFGSEAPIVVRLPFIGLFALSTWLMYRLGGRCVLGCGRRPAEPVAGVRGDDGNLGAAGRAARMRVAGGGSLPDPRVGTGGLGMVARCRAVRRAGAVFQGTPPC